MVLGLIGVPAVRFEFLGTYGFPQIIHATCCPRERMLQRIRLSRDEDAERLIRDPSQAASIPLRRPGFFSGS
jgi:hypothetical protein